MASVYYWLWWYSCKVICHNCSRCWVQIFVPAPIQSEFLKHQWLHIRQLLPLLSTKTFNIYILRLKNGCDIPRTTLPGIRYPCRYKLVGGMEQNIRKGKREINNNVLWGRDHKGNRVGGGVDTHTHTHTHTYIYIYIYSRRWTRWTWVVVTQSFTRYAIIRQV